MSPTDPASLRFQRLLAFLDEDTEDLAPDDEVQVDRDRMLEAARQRAGKLRFAQSKAQLAADRETPVAPPILPPEVVARAREILAAIVRDEPTFREKYSLAFRNGKDLPEAEVLSILAELQLLGVDLIAIARKLVG